MKNLLASLLLASSLSLLGCGDDGGTGNPDAAPDPGDAAGYTCDPVGPNPGMGALLNAPVDSDVEVIVKAPQHPGDPGPNDLP